MIDSDPPPDSAPPPSPPEQAREGRRRRLVESVIPEVIKRAVEIGVEKARESPDNLKQFVGDLRLPKEIAHYLLQQIDETKNGLFRVVAKEIRDFLEHTNFAGEMQKLLTTVQFEVNTTIRFTPNDGRDARKAKERDRERAKERGEREREPDERVESGAEDEDLDDLDAAASEGGERTDRASLPKPEVKTAVHVRRDERERRRRGPRGG